jgi:hypothetical protein
MENSMSENPPRRRRRFKQALSLQQRLEAAAQQCRTIAQQRSGKERDALMRAAGRYEVTAHIDEWLSSPGLRRPK